MREPEKTGWRWLVPQLALLGTVGLAGTWLMTLSVGALPANIAEEAIAPYDIRADRHYVLEDAASTERARADGLARVRPVYDLRTDVSSQRLAQLSRFCQLVHTSQLAADPERAVPLRLEAQGVIGLELTDLQWHQLLDMMADSAECPGLRLPLESAYASPLLAASITADPNSPGIVTVRRIADDRVLEESDWLPEQVAGLSTVKDAATQFVVRFENKRLHSLEPLLERLLEPTLVWNEALTQGRRQQFLDSFAPITETVRAGEVLARRDEPYTAEQVRRLRAIQAQKGGGLWPISAAGTWVVVCLLLWVLDQAGTRHLRTYRMRLADRALLGALLILLVGLLRAGGIFSEALASGLQLGVPVRALYYALPFGVGGMLVRLLFPTTVALVFALALSLLSGLLFLHDPTVTIYAVTLNIVGIVAIVGADKRWLILRAGLLMGLFGALFAMALHGMRATDIGERFSLTTLWWFGGLAIAGGMVAGVLVLVIMPIAEYFGHVSDIKLLELANLNHPLLRELVIRAPGTYHHSHLVGIIGEAAATAIGANALFVRVSAYYHDIGKLRKPAYFVENQTGGVSPHERLSPHMSALIVAAHVKEGIELAKANKLPQQVIDMIPQHHGTKRIGGFFERAKQLAEGTDVVVEETEFRYPGPKPQTREAGVLLLADGIEGAVRALPEKTALRIEQTVEAIVNKTFAEGQLDECDLTLKNLNDIGKACIRILTGIYHQRVEYPREVLQLTAKDVQVFDGTPATPHSPAR